MPKVLKNTQIRKIRKMKIREISDSHCEFSAIKLPNPNREVDTLILGGDICVASKFNRGPESPFNKRFNEFFELVSNEYDNVIFVMGNHEHYDGNFDKTYEILKEKLHPFKNIHLLEQEKIEIDGIIFLGATIWTDLNGCNELVINTLKHGMNDYRCVTKFKYAVHEGDSNYRRLHPMDTYNVHKHTVDWLKQQLALHIPSTQKVVICGHHAPSKMSTHPRFAHDVEMNGGYSSNLEYIMEEHPNIVYWFHGHTHDNFDYTINKTRVISNPRGYSYHDNDHDENPRFDPNLILEI